MYSASTWIYVKYIDVRWMCIFIVSTAIFFSLAWYKFISTVSTMLAPTRLAFQIYVCVYAYIFLLFIYIYISLCSLAPVSSTHSLPMLSAPNSDISLYVNDHSSLLISKFQCPFLWFSLYPLPLLKVTSHLLEFIYCITNFLFKISTAITVVSLSSWSPVWSTLIDTLVSFSLPCLHTIPLLDRASKESQLDKWLFLDQKWFFNATR